MLIKRASLKNLVDPKRYRRPTLLRTILALVVCTTLILATVSTYTGTQHSGNIAAASAPLPDSQERDINTLFYNYELMQLNLKEVAQTVRVTGRISLQITGKRYDLELERNNLLAPGFRAVITTENGVVDEVATGINTYKGRVASMDESDVRLLIQDDLMSGYIRVGDEWLFIDPLGRYMRGAETGRLIAYRDADVRPEARGICGSEGLERQSERLFKGSPPQADPAGATVGIRIVDVATDADFEFFQANGANSNAVIQGVINQVNGIYTGELSLTLRITFQNVYAAADDPYTAADVGTLLTQFTDYWNINRAGVPRDAAHLFTGRPLDGATVGLAWTGVVCNAPTFAYGLSKQIASMAKLTAHEIGHNFNAVHDDPAICNGGGPIMCAFIQLNGPNQFSQPSKDAIAAHINNFGLCLEAGSSVIPRMP